MTCGEPPSHDDRLDALLIGYDRSLRGEQPGEIVDAAAAECDQELATRFRDAKECLDLLDRVRRSEVSHADNSIGAADGGPSAKVDGQDSVFIDRFQLVRELGRGGLGVVLLAFDPRLRRQVAIKIPRPDLVATDDSRRRFVREAEAAAKLNHPHVASMHEVGQDGPLCYLVGEYCPGLTLAQWLTENREPLAPRLVATFVRRLAEGVQHAHSRGVLHRDIKPSNVILATREAPNAAGANGLDAIPKLTDFGLAKILEEDSQATRTGTILGTPAYMAPEQAGGQTSELDARTDVYALGAILYELLTGTPPYQGQSDLDTLRQLIVNEPTPPRRRRPDVPADLESICQKSLERNPADRYQTAQALVDDLDRFLAGRPTEARPLSAFAATWKWARRRPAVSVLLVLLAASAVTLFVSVAGFNTRLRREIVVANSARQDAERAASTSRRLLYAADVRLASEAFKADNVAEALALLQRQEPQSGQVDLREFAWRYLVDQCTPDTLLLAGHTGTVFAVAYSPDGSLVATAGKDGTVRTWDAVGGEPLHTLFGHSSEVTCVAFSADGNTLASGSEDKTVRLWNATDGTLVRVLQGHSDHVMAALFSSDGELLATGGRDGTVRLWETSSGKCINVLGDNLDVVRSVAFVPKQDLICAGDESGNLSAWSLPDGQLRDRASLERERFFAMTSSPDGQRIFVAGRRENIGIWGFSDGKLSLLQTLEGGHTEWIRGLAASRDGILASAGADAVVKLWRSGESSFYRTLLGHRGDVWSVAWSPDGSHLASAGNDGVRIWSVDHRGTENRFPPGEIGQEFLDATFDVDGRTLLAGTTDGRLLLWDVSRPIKSVVVSSHSSRLTAVRISTDGQFVATCGGDNFARVWDRATLKEVFAAPCARQSDTLAWSPIGHHLAIAPDASHVQIVDIDSSQTAREFQIRGFVREALFTPDGRCLITTSNQALQVWDLNDGSLRHESLSSYWNLAISSDGSTVAADSGPKVSLIRLDDGYRQSSLVTQGTEIQGLAIHGATLAVAIERPTLVGLWDIRTGQLLMTLECDAAQIRSVCFAPDGSRLIAAGHDAANRARIWEWAVRAGQ